ncbi:ribbon-helix-helix domain-containing protein [Haloarchaeobius sp. TZWWS8]|uniref:ribbon-helix-helix domain-containing protein n=1 Tax=Haloarchaeobius sp. TZWWS8 TaxID=3446121 RepID=UPI003EBDA5D7
MPKAEISMSDTLDAELDRLVASGDFLNREDAVEELISLGISAYGPAEETREERGDLFNQSLNDQQDPAARNDTDGYGY